jgi:hypothetical protein
MYFAIKPGHFYNLEFDVKHKITPNPCTKNNEIFMLFNGFAAVTPKKGAPKLRILQIYDK